MHNKRYTYYRINIYFFKTKTESFQSFVNFNELYNNFCKTLTLFIIKIFKIMKKLEKNEEASMLDIALECGFNNTANFNKIFK